MFLIVHNFTDQSNRNIICFEIKCRNQSHVFTGDKYPFFEKTVRTGVVFTF